MRKSATVFLTAGLLMLGCGSRTAQSYTAPAFELKDLSGKTFTLESFRGKAVVLDFWATWCGPCRMSIPMLQAFYKKHQNNDLVVLGINMDDDPSGVYSFVEKIGITYPVLYGGSSDIGSNYRVEGIPSFVFIDRKGQIVDRYDGFSAEMLPAWESTLQRILAEPKS